MTGSNDGGWSRAFLASSGLSMAGDGARRHPSAEEHEASASDTPKPRLRELSVSRDQRVREVVARRHDCPVGALASLAHDRHDDVRVAVASNPTAGRAILEHLVGDRSASVLLAVARNSGTPRDLVERLAVHRRPEVRRIAGRRLDDASPAPAQPAPSHLPPELVERAQVTVESNQRQASGNQDPARGVLAPRPVVPVRVPRGATRGAGWVPRQ